ncbi:uncharacterized protein LOC141784151 [Halichoeres trimaculatus]|uniref:uncharacterized protein LOC141784151 n=1 Tax=Halichoeres trimaculatus TaxID=147232 RepID=UPI003D9E9D2A
MIHIMDFVFLSCLFLSVESLTDEISPPSNLSLIWDVDFSFNFSWAPPLHWMKNCKYKITAESKERDSDEEDTVTEPYWSSFKVLEGGFLNLSVKTVCGVRESKVVYITMSDPDLVKNFQCNIVSLKLTRCTWFKATNISDLHFFYRLSTHFQSSYEPIQECPLYRYSGGLRTGCDLQANTDQIMTIFINGTLDSKPVRNIFERNLIDHVKPPALDWHVKETKDNFIISWIPPEVKLPWKYVLNYTECKTQKKTTGEDLTTRKLRKVSHCEYWMSIKAEYEKSETPWSEEKYFAADTDQSTMVYAAVIIPLLCAILAVVAFVCCRKNKENICPKIPEPRNLLSDIYNNNNNKDPDHNLYIPEEEEDNCVITLVIDPQTDKSLR